MKKSLLILPALMFLVACNSTPACPPSTTETSVSSAAATDEEKFEMFRNAVLFDGNETFTGYRLDLSLRSITTNETVYSLYRTFEIDAANNFGHLSETITRIADSQDSIGATQTITNEYYYEYASNNLGTIYTLQPDNSFASHDGQITRSTGLPTINPTMDSFTSLTLNLTGNVLNFEGNIDSSKANAMFGSERLSTIQEGTMTASLYDSLLERVSWNYIQDDFRVEQRINVSYNAVTITLPTT